MGLGPRRQGQRLALQPLQLVGGQHPGALGCALRLRQQRLGAADLALLVVAPLQWHLQAQLDLPRRAAREVIDRRAPGDVGSLQGQRCIARGAGRLHPGVGGAHVAALVDQAADVSGGRVWQGGKRPIGSHPQVGRRQRADQAGQRQRGTRPVQLGQVQVEPDAPGLDLAAVGVLGGQIAGLDPALRGGRQLRRTAGDQIQLGDAMLGGQQVDKGAQRGKLLLQPGVVKVGSCRLGAALGSQRAQGPLATPLPGPIEPDRLVDALVAQQIAGTDAVLQVDRRCLGRQQRQGRMVGGQDVGASGIDVRSRQRHQAVVARRCQHLGQAERGAGLGLAGACGQAGQQGQKLSYPHGAGYRLPRLTST